MAGYWVKHFPADTPRGPFSGTQLRAMAASGRLTHSVLISADQNHWTTAANVTGLFEQTLDASPQQPPPVSAEPEPQNATILSPPQQLGYATGIGCQPRKVQWYLISAIVIVGVSVIQIVLQFGSMAWMMSAMPATTGPSSTVVTTRNGRVMTTTTTAGRRPPGFAPGMLAMSIAGSVLRLLAVLASLGLFIYFTIWAYQVHQDMRQLSGGTYPISPGKACGFCWIPFFNLYWIVYMPYKLSEAVDWHLGANRTITNPTLVLIFQILQLVVNFTCACFLSPAPIFYALTMRDIQKGLNELCARTGYVPPAAPSA